jgi:hypothetical protein
VGGNRDVGGGWAPTMSWWGMSFRFKDFKFFNNLLVLDVNVELCFNC